MDDPRGSLWRKWDLHVHTPESLTRPYGGSSPAAWAKFLDDLERLPPEFKVIGVNDYIFIDGYRRIVDERRKGRLKNIQLILPVIELRLNIFGGTAGHLAKVNYHIIFSDELDSEIIQQHFLNALPNKYVLTPAYAVVGRTWSALATRQSLEELGRLIIDSVTPSKRPEFGSPLSEGFSNISFDLENIRQALRSHYFNHKYLTAVGKTEWANIKWNDHSIADKKNLVNSADIVFISAQTPDDWRKAQDHLKMSEVNSKLLDCSDAHHFSDSAMKDRLGKCFTWIKADPSFDGLRLAKIEYESRVFVGEKPEKLVKVQSNPTKYIRSIAVKKTQDAIIEETWFDYELELNPDLIAVIGNKGSGKSALVDIIGLLGNSRQSSHFSFLNEDKFRQPRDNKARNFQGTLVWESGNQVSRRLDAEIPDVEVETVKYLPQNYLEIICNEAAPLGGETAFDKELKKVIFSHIDPADRFGEESLDALLDRRTLEAYGAITILSEDLRKINREIIKLEEQGTAEHKKSLENQLQAKQSELDAHIRSRPPEVPQPQTDPGSQELITKLSSDINSRKRELDALVQQIREAETEQRELATKVLTAETVLGKLRNFERQFESFRRDSEGGLAQLGLKLDDVAQVTLNPKPIIETEEKLQAQKKSVDNSLDPTVTGTLAEKRSTMGRMIAELQGMLDEPHRKYQEYLTAVSTWEMAKGQLEGDSSTPGTARYYQAQLAQLVELPRKLAEAKQRRRAKADGIYSQIKDLADKYAELYQPVQQFIENHPLAQQHLQLHFTVSIADDGFASRFLEYIDQRTAGSFSGIAEGEQVIRRLLSQTDFDDKIKTILFLDEVIEHLTHDRRHDKGEPLNVKEQLKSGRTVEQLYDFIFSMEYLRPKYALRMAGKDLYELSPGERGMLLLIFYLLVDRSDIPMIIDQPEENLDNQTVYEVLVPSIKEAKQRRQVVIVTHNPNLAVVCDAEQIVYAAQDRTEGHKITYVPGSIENLIMNRKIVDVLEGTRPAFDRRESKYLNEKTST